MCSDLNYYICLEMARNQIKEWSGDLIKQETVVIYLFCITGKHTLQLSVT